MPITKSYQPINPFQIFVYKYHEYIVDRDGQVHYKGKDRGETWWFPVSDGRDFANLDWVRVTDRHCDPNKIMIRFLGEYIRPLNIFKVGSTLFVYDTYKHLYFFDKTLNGWRPTTEIPRGGFTSTNDYCDPALNNQINKFFPICNGKYYLAPYQIFYDIEGAKYLVDKDGNYYNDVSIDGDGKSWSPCNYDKPSDNEIGIITDSYVAMM